MPAPMSSGQEQPSSDTVIWSVALVATMIGMIEESIVLSGVELLGDVAPWRRIQIQRALLKLLERERDDWIIADVPTTLIDELRPLRSEAHRRLAQECE